MAKLPHIEQALLSGATMHAFLSGGGLRVVRVTKNEKLIGYGEHPHIEGALHHTNDDIKAGGRPYNEVYGKLKPYYITGSSTPSCPLDRWVRQGHTFDVHADGDEFVVESELYVEVDDLEEQLQLLGV